MGFCAGKIFFEEIAQGGHSVVNWYLATCVSHSHIRAVVCTQNAEDPLQNKELILERRDGGNCEKEVKSFRGKTELFSNTLEDSRNGVSYIN